MRILGLDPGLRVTGYGVIDKDGSKLSYVTSGCIKSPDGELPDRLKNILNSVQEVIRLFSPGEVAVEKVFVEHGNERRFLALKLLHPAFQAMDLTQGILVYFRTFLLVII